MLKLLVVEDIDNQLAHVAEVVRTRRPVGESVVAGGPFLMNTAEENAAAMAEFQAGLFGPIPNDPTPTDAATRR